MDNKDEKKEGGITDSISIVNEITNQERDPVPHSTSSFPPPASVTVPSENNESGTSEPSSLEDSPNIEADNNQVDDVRETEPSPTSLKGSRVLFAEENNLVRVYKGYSGDIEVGQQQNCNYIWRKEETKDNGKLCDRVSGKSSKLLEEIHKNNNNKNSKTNISNLMNSTFDYILRTCPNVEQTLDVYPVTAAIASGHRSASFAHARRQSGNIKHGDHATEREPRHSGEDSRRKSHLAGRPDKPMIISTARSRSRGLGDGAGSERSGGGQHPRSPRKSTSSGPGRKKLASRSSLSVRTDGSTITNTDDQTTNILGTIREKNEEVEMNTTCAKVTRCWRQCCRPCAKCCSSRQCTCITFIAAIAIVTISCILAIAFPVLKLINEHKDDMKSESHPSET